MVINRSVLSPRHPFKQGLINVCTLLVIYFLIDLMRVQLAKRRNELNNTEISQDFRTFAELSINKSNISGLGVIVNNPIIPSGALIVNVLIVNNSTFGRYSGMPLKITKYGRKINHKIDNNARPIKIYEGYSLQAIRDIYQGEELFVDYVDFPFFICPPSPFWDYNALIIENHAYIEFILRGIITIFFCPQNLFK